MPLMWTPSTAGKRLAAMMLLTWATAFIWGSMADTPRGFAIAAWLVIVAVAVTVAAFVIASFAIFGLSRDPSPTDREPST